MGREGKVHPRDASSLTNYERRQVSFPAGRSRRSCQLAGPIASFSLQIGSFLSWGFPGAGSSIVSYFKRHLNKVMMGKGPSHHFPQKPVPQQFYECIERGNMSIVLGGTAYGIGIKGPHRGLTGDPPRSSGVEKGPKGPSVGFRHRRSISSRSIHLVVEAGFCGKSMGGMGRGPPKSQSSCLCTDWQEVARHSTQSRPSCAPPVVGLGPTGFCES